MAEQSSVPNSTTNAPLQESELTQNSTIGYGVARPSFSYLNSTDMPPGNSQQSSSVSVSENVMSSSAPPFSYNASNSSGQPLSTTMNVRANGIQEKGPTASTPAFPNPAPPHAFTNFNNLASNNFSNPGSWLPLTPRPTGIASSLASPSNMNANPSMSTVQHQAVNLYPSPSPPGPWLQPQQIPPFARPPFSPYAPGPYTMPTHAMRPLSAAFPDIQPPGVSPSVSSIGARKPSFDSEQADVPPGTVNSSRIVSNDETRNETSGREQLYAWTAHRTDTGTVYYYNALTGESTYEKPPSFKGESDKAISQPSPVSWEKLPGTEWTLVTTNDGKRYYYNSRTQISSWQVPSEVTELRKKQEADALKAQSISSTNPNTVAEKGSPPVSLSTPAAESGGRDAITVRPLSVSGTSALDLIKRKLQDSGLPASTSPGPADAVALDVNGSKSIEATVKGPQNENKDKNNGDMSDSSSDSEDEDRGPTKEECILQFKEMLKERGVAPFSKWEKELPKIVFDPRFKAIPSHSARRALFEHYVRTRAEEERKEKRAAQKAALEGFKQLLEEAKEDISHDTDYHSFKKKWGDDPRFQTLDRKERESLLNERVLPLKKAAQERAQAERAAAISNFKMMLQEKGDITSSTRWSKVKDSLRSDDRYKSVKHEDREKLFNEYVAELKAAKEEIERKVKAKQDEEDKLKERERALRKRKEREEQEVERVKMKALRKEAIESYQALLVEKIKDPQASWTESKTKLEKDPQGRSANPHLDKSDLEKLFREHVKSLYERCVVEFRALLNEVITVEAAAQDTEEGKTVISSWSTAKQVLKKDPRYNRVPRKDRESLWRRHADDIQRKQKSMQDQETDGKARSSVDSGKHLSGSKRAYNKR